MTSNGTSAVTLHASPAAHRLGRLCQGHLHRHGGDDAFGAGRREAAGQTASCMPLVDVRKTVPDAGFLPDFRPVPVRRDRPRLAHLSRPQGRAFRLFLRAVGDDPVRLQGAVLRRRDGLAPCRLSVSAILHRAVRHAVVHLSAADLLRRHQTDTPLPAAGDLARRRGAGNGAYRDRLDRDRRILRALRLFLFRLSVRLLRVRAVGSRAGASPRWRWSAWRCGRWSMAAW